MITKDELRKRFSEDWKKHYDLEVLREYGFKRYRCKKCGRYFWSVVERDTCGSETCDGYSFIGNPVGKPHTYIASWKTIESYFTSHGHKSVYTYPSVARWRDDLYFTIASISDFQPYVVRGEVEPPGNPLIIPQVCIRFGDISNVGVTGRHCTNFVMVGQHAFNTKRTGLFYWKNEAIGHDIEMLKSFGIPLEEITFIEDVWMGGGNFGPSMEYFVRGLELGNCVFMQYETLSDGSTGELDTKVIDMGAGLERFAWVTNGTPTLYDVAYAGVVERMFKDANIDYDRGIATRFWSLAGALDIESGEKALEHVKMEISSQLSMPWEDIVAEVRPYQAVYAAADHLKTLLLAVTDGQLPSNSGGGYNLRMILRRTFGFDEQYNLNLDYAGIIKDHASVIKPLFPHYSDGVDSVVAVIEEEKKKYVATKNKARAKIRTVISKYGDKVPVEVLVRLYQSDGVSPELLAAEAKTAGIDVEVPANFYDLVKQREEVEEVSHHEIDVSEFDETIKKYYEDLFEMDATVIGIKENAVILDRTCFYPEGGGQVGDTGYIDDVRVIDTVIRNKVILHMIDSKDIGKLKTGQKVHIRIDKDRRRQITLHHTGVHLINACAREVLGPHVWQAGAYKDEEKGQIDITHYKRITDEELDAIERLANRYIRMNLPIVIEELERTQAEQKYGFRIYQGGAVPGKRLRIVSIDDIDHEACGGTHHMIKNLGELGFLKIVRRETVRDGVERIIIKCGDAAVRYVQGREKILRDVAGLMKSPESQLVRSTEKFVNEWKRLKKEVDKLRQTVAESKFKEIVSNCKNVQNRIVEIELDLDRDLMSKIGQMITQSDEPLNLILINRKTGDVVCAVSRTSGRDVSELVKTVIKKYNGKGGGKGRLGFVKIPVR